MAISSCWLHSPKGHSLGTVHDTKTFFPSQAKVLTAAFAHQPASGLVLSVAGPLLEMSSCVCPRLGVQLCKSYITTGLPPQQVQQTFSCLYEHKPCQGLACTGQFLHHSLATCVLTPAGLLMEGLLHHALHPKVHPETSLIFCRCLGALQR